MNQVVPYQNPELDKLKAMAAIVVRSGKYGPEYNEATVLNISLTAKAMGVDPMIALNSGFHIINGKISMGAHMMAALIRKKGHSVKIIEITKQKCVIISQRKDNGDSLKFEYTIEDATLAGLVNRDVWKKYPKLMLYCRCMATIYRMLYSDLGIAYDPDELDLPVNPEKIESEISLQPPDIEIKDEELIEPIDRLETILKEENIDTEDLKKYFDELSVIKNVPAIKLITSALNPDILPRFKAAYLEKISKKELVEVAS